MFNINNTATFSKIISVCFLFQLVLTSLGLYVYYKINVQEITRDILDSTNCVQELNSVVDDRTIVWPELPINGYTEEEIINLSKENPDNYPATSTQIK